MQAMITEALKPMAQKLEKMEDWIQDQRTRTKSSRGRERNSADRRKQAPTATKDLITFTDEDVDSDLRDLGVHDVSTTSSEDTVTEGTTKPTTANSSSDGKKVKKSGRDLTAEDCHGCTIPWPHHKVRVGLERRGQKFDKLMVSEFVLGFMRQCKDEKFEKDKEIMHDFLMDLMEDHTDWPEEWENIRSFHSVFLAMVESGEATWTDTAKISKMKNRMIYAGSNKSSSTSTTNSKTHTAQPTRTDKPTVVCYKYQTAECYKEDGHQGFTHCCSYCLREKGRMVKHPERDCYSLHGGPKKRFGKH